MIVPHPSKVIVRIYAKERWSLFNKEIKRNDGTSVVLAIGHEWDDERLDASYAQNVSVGEVIAVGSGIPEIVIGDLAIIDYLVDNNRDSIVEINDDYKDIAVWAKCVYHQYDAPKESFGRRAFYKGEYKKIGQVFGVVRKDRLIAIEPYIFLEHESNVINMFERRGMFGEETIVILERKVLAAYPGSYTKEGEILVVQDGDIFERVIDGRTISTMFNCDVKLFKI